MDILKTLNLGIAFFLEIAMLAAFVYWGFHINIGLVGRILLGIGVPTLVIIAWAIWLAPTAVQRLGMPWLVVLKVVIFGLASLCLYLSNKKSLAFSLIGVFVLSELLGIIWGQEQTS
jgi:hypothetical protein